MKRVDMKNKSLIFIFATIFVVLATMIVSAEGNVNISLVIPGGNGTLYTMSNMTVVLNFTIINGTSLAGSNFSMSVDGTARPVFCNVSSSATVPSATNGGNASGCLGDGVINKLYLNLTEGRHTIVINATYGNALQANSTASPNPAATLAVRNTTFFVNNFDTFAWGANSSMQDNNVSLNAISVNVTFNSIVVKNVTFWLYNNTGAATYSTNETFGGFLNNTGKGIGWDNLTIAPLVNNSKSWLMTWTGLKEGSFTYIINITDANTGKNSTLIRQIRLDTTNPTVAYSCSGYYNADTLEVEKDDADFACTCVGSDTNDSNPSETIINAVSLSTTGTKGTDCRASDHAGNNVTHGTIVYKVVELSDGTDGGTTTGGSSTGGSTTTGGSSSITGSTYTVTAEQLSTGTTKALSKNDGFKITFRPSAATTTEQHTIKVSAITTTSATIIISSDPITVSMNIGEEKKVDIDGDGTYDVYVKLNSITSGKANFTVKQISEQIPASEPGPVSGEDTQTAPEPKKSNLWLWIVLLIVVVAIAGVAYYMMNNKRR